MILENLNDSSGTPGDFQFNNNPHLITGGDASSGGNMRTLHIKDEDHSTKHNKVDNIILN